MKDKKNFLLLFILLLLPSCALVTNEHQESQRKVITYLLEDFPLPGDSKIIEPTLLLGTGKAISGRIILTSGYSPAENLVFYGTETLATGWNLVSSKVGEKVTLVYQKDGRIATIYISPKRNMGNFISGSYGSDIDISVIHPDAIGIQDPYIGLNYEDLNENTQSD
ncbi:MAG: hypothetical protein P8I12_05995 [SAR86 cluster bacterium]|nr:hypothetical protein [SAR86 cluster bacterium]